MKRSSTWGNLVVIFIAAAVAMPMGAAAEDGEDGDTPPLQWVVVDQGDAIIVTNVKIDNDLPNSMGLPPKGLPGGEEGDQPPEDVQMDNSFQSKNLLPNEEKPVVEEAIAPPEGEAPSSAPIVVIDDGGVADDAGDLLEEADDNATATMPVEIPAIFEEAHWHYVGSGGCATLMPGAPASAGSALSMLLWLAPLAAIRRGNKRAS